MTDCDVCGNPMMVHQVEDNRGIHFSCPVCDYQKIMVYKKTTESYSNTGFPRFYSGGSLLPYWPKITAIIGVKGDHP